MVQKSILSFFGSAKTSKAASSSTPLTPTQTKKDGATSKRKEVVEVDDSPIKASKSAKSRIIDSESEEEIDRLNSPKEAEKENNETQVNKTPIKTPQKVESPKKSPLKAVQGSPVQVASSSKSVFEKNFEDSVIPPLRKTARKQMKRKSGDSTEDRQMELIKKLKSGEKNSETKVKDTGTKSTQGTGKGKTSPKSTAKNKSIEASKPKAKETPKSKLAFFKFTKKNSTPQENKPTVKENEDENTSSANILDVKTSQNKDVETSKIEDVKDEAASTDEQMDTTPSQERENGDLDSSVLKNNLKITESSPKSVKGTPKSIKGTPKSSKNTPKSSKSTPKSSTKNPKASKSTPKSSKNTPKASRIVSSDEEEDDSKMETSTIDETPLEDNNEGKLSENNSDNGFSDKKIVSSSEKDSKKESKTTGETSKPTLKMRNPFEKQPKPIENESVKEEKSENESKTSEETDENSKPSTPKKRNPFEKQPKPKKSTYNPSKPKYHPIDDACWKKGESVPYLALSETFSMIEDTKGRLKTIEMLANFLRSVIALTPDDLLPCVYLCLNKVAPAFKGIELQVGDSFLMKAIAQATGRSMDRLKKDKAEYGDLGIVAEQSKSTQKMMFQPPPLMANKVFNSLKEVGSMSGQASQAKKVEKIKGMFVACRESEARFFIRSLTGKLRIGLAEQSILQALAQACCLTPPGKDVMNAGKGLSAEEIKHKVEEQALVLKTTYSECPSYDSVIPVLLEHGLMALPNHCKLEPGVPLHPMLANPTKGVDEVLKRFEKCRFTCEYKYDGERAQIHLLENKKMKVFSRNLEDNTTKYPDIINRIGDSYGEGLTSFVMDSEVVAYNIEEKKILPFQILTTRKRKDVIESDIKVKVCVFPFDLLYLNGENLVKKTFEYRRKLLKENFKEIEGHLMFATSMDGTDTEEIQEFLEESIKGNCEGLMVKSLDIDATYEIAKRSKNWLKLKKDYLDGVGDTIDVVPIGGYLGKGKRTGVYGGFLLACYDPENEEYQSLCKIGTGFSDDILQKHAAFFKDLIIDTPKSYYRCDMSLAPDVWFDAGMVKVWEIKCADLSISPVYKAANGLVDPEKGISLRFPRFIRIRDDKNPEQATSAQQIADMYNNQDQIKNQTTTNTNEDDYY